MFLQADRRRYLAAVPASQGKTLPVSILFLDFSIISYFLRMITLLYFTVSHRHRRRRRTCVLFVRKKLKTYSVTVSEINLAKYQGSQIYYDICFNQGSLINITIYVSMDIYQWIFILFFYEEMDKSV